MSTSVQPTPPADPLDAYEQKYKPPPATSAPSSDPLDAYEAKYGTPAVDPLDAYEAKYSTPQPTPSILDRVKGVAETVGAGALKLRNTIGNAEKAALSYSPTYKVGGTTITPPSLLTQAKVIGSAAAAPIKSAYDAFLSPVQGETVTPTQALGVRNSGPMPGTLPAGTVVTPQNSPSSITPQRFNRALVETGANAVAGLAGGGAGALAERAGAGPLVGRLTSAAAGGVLPGAAYSPEHPIRGALTGAATGLIGGEVTRGAGRILPRAADADADQMIDMMPSASEPPAHPALPAPRAPLLLGPGPTSPAPEAPAAARPSSIGQSAPRPVYNHGDFLSTLEDEGPPTTAPGSLLTRDAKGNLKRNLSGVPVDHLVAEYGQIGSRVAQSGAQAPWVRINEYNDAISGHGRGLGAVNSQMKAMNRIEAELKSRGLSGEAINDKLYELSSQYRYSGLPLSPEHRATLGQAYRDALVEPYPMLGNEGGDATLKAALNEKGAAGDFAGHLANYGLAHVEAGIPAAKLPQIEQSLYADNMEAQAAKLAAKGKAGPAANLTKAAAALRSKVPANIKADPDYQAYVQRYQSTIEPEWERVAKASGLSDQGFRQLPPNSAYVPLPGKMEAGDVPKRLVYRPPTAARRAQASGAVKEAVGGGDEPLSVRQAILSHMPGRQRVAANNGTLAAVQAVGRTLPSADAPLADGETAIAFDDKNHIVAPNAETARQHVAVPTRVADALRESDARMAPPPPNTGIRKVFNAAKGGVTRLETGLSPAILPVHGRNIVSTVGAQSGGAARDAAASLPLGKGLSGVARMHNVRFTDPDVAKTMIGAARYGGLRAADSKPGILNAGGRALFAPTGLDPRGRAAIAALYKAQNPQATDAQVAQHVANELGNYVHANQPTGVRALQSSGVTSFAPASVAFTRGAIRRATMTGAGTVGQKLGRFGRTVASPLALLEAANMATTGHSTLSNAAGHRMDLQVTGTGPLGGAPGKEGGNRYLGLSTIDPLLSRALNQSGARGIIEGEGVGGAVRRAANATMAHLGVGPRVIAGAANVEPYFNKDGSLAQVEPADFTNHSTLARAKRAAGAALGGPAALAGATSFSQGQTMPERVAGAFGINTPYEDYRTKPGPPPNPSGGADKENAAVTRIYRASSPAERRQIADQEVANAEKQGYSPGYVAMLHARLGSALKKANATTRTP